MSDRGVTLTRSEPTRIEGENAPTWRVVIVAEDPVLMPSEIFLFQRVYTDSAHTATRDELITVVQAVDIVEYPTDDPATGQDPPFFRLSQIDVLVPSLDAADQMWTIIKASVGRLVTQLNRLDSIAVTDSVRIGADLADSESV